MTEKQKTSDKPPERELSKDELMDAQTLSQLIYNVHKCEHDYGIAQHEMFTFFEQVDEDSKGPVYDHAMKILSAYQDYVHNPPKVLQ